MEGLSVAPLYERHDDDDDDDDALQNELDESPRTMAMRAVLRYAPFCVQFQERVSLLQVSYLSLLFIEYCCSLLFIVVCYLIQCL